MKTVIMAGGRGTRLSAVAQDIPKPMVPVGGMPVLEYELGMLRSQGFTDIIITVGHLGSIIMDYFGDGSGLSPVTGQPFGVHIEYFVEKAPLGNAGALLLLRDRLTEDFLLLNGDVVFNADLKRMAAFHQEKAALATLFVHPNSHPYDSGLLIEDENGSVMQWLTKEEARPEFYHNIVNAGIHILNVHVVDELLRIYPPEDDAPCKIDLDRQVLRPLAGSGRMVCYHSPEYVKDMGTPDRLDAVRQDFESGRIQSGALIHPQKAVFLDRDGTINAYVGFLRRAEDFSLLPDVAAAIRRIHDCGYLAIVVTNQPVIARGETTFEELDRIHRKMETLLGLEGAYVDDLFFCPHHPDAGFPGERPEFKIRCNCRKPAPGLLLAAARKYNIDLAQSWMVGDSQRDVAAGQNAGCRTALIDNGAYGQTITVTSLLDFARQLEGGF